MFSESDVHNLLSGLQQLQITIANAAQSTALQSTTKTQQADSPESTTKGNDDISDLVEPINKIANIIIARTPQHPSREDSESDYAFPNKGHKRQLSPRCSPAKKRLKEQNSKMMETATTLTDDISK